jgi:Leucine-rich repeat (LRR) protein
MQVNSSNTAQFSPSSFLPPHTEASVLLLPLHGYHQYQPPISTQAPAIDMVAGQDYLMPELIEMIQSLCLPQALLALTSINKAAFATRFYNPALMHLYFATSVQIEQFLSNYETKQTSAVFTGAIRTRKDFQSIKALTLTLSDTQSVEQAARLFTCLPGVIRLEIRLAGNQCIAFLGPLLKAARYLTLTHLAINREDNEPGELAHLALPAELWQWHSLKILDLSVLDNIHSIPEDIGKLINLTELCLGASKANSELIAFPESLGQLTKLERLEIRKFSALHTLPQAIGQLIALKSLTLSELNALTTLPTSLCQLNKLEVLQLYDLGIDKLPKAINQLSALKTLLLWNMGRVTTLPAGVWQLNELEVLGLWDLGIDNVPEAISQLSTLKSLTLSLTRRDGIPTLPAGIWQLNKLEELELWGLDIDSIPEAISQLSALKSLSLRGLDRITTLPAGLWQLNKLEALELWDFDIDTIPEAISQLSELKSLNLSNMDGISTLPAGVWQLDQLEELELCELGIDNISEAIGQLQSLKRLTLDTLPSLNVLPVNLWRLSKLEKLRLISLTIKLTPEEISQPPLLKAVYLTATDISEEVVNYLKNKGVRVVVKRI